MFTNSYALIIGFLNDSMQKIEMFIKKFFNKLQNFMLMKKNRHGYFYRSFSYALLFLCAFLAIAIFFKEGYFNGHDTIFHASQVRSYIDSIRAGDFSGHLASSLLKIDIGVSIRMFYSSLSHTVTALVYLLLMEPLGFTLTTAFKFITFFNFFLAGIFCYELLIRVTKGNHLVSLLGGVIFAFNPYHFTNGFVRNAFAEHFAYMFIPYFFLSLFDVLNIDPKEENMRFKPFFNLMLSTTLLLLSHNITAMYTVIFGVIYMFFNMKKIIALSYRPRFYAYGAYSVFGTLVLFSPLLVPLIVQSDLSIRLFGDVMYANLDGILSSFDDGIGFLTYSFNVKYFTAGFIAFGAITVCAVIACLIFKKNRWVSPLAAFISGIVGAIVYESMTHSFLHSLFLGLIGGLLAVFLLLKNYGVPKNNKRNRIYLGDIFGFLTLLVITAAFAFIKDIWQFLPDILYKIQFRFRLFSFLIFFGAIVLAIIIDYMMRIFKRSELIIPLGIFCVIISPNYASIYNMSNYGDDWRIENINIKTAVSLGWQYEYLPSYFYEDFDFSDPTQPQVFFDVYRLIFSNNFANEIILPAVGKKTELESYSFNSSKKGELILSDVSETEITTITLPVFYYHGYEVNYYADGVKDPVKIENYNLKGLLSFDIEPEKAGKYVFSFEGTTAIKLSTASFFIFIASTAILSVSFSLRNKVKRQEKEFEMNLKE